ncbi:MAG: Hpt domain-containing protein [Candidatus Omnitrophica bacterium]|nr:Hpt domain-containing protein [Candidatus Omnitrophota bacterium]
MEEILNEFHENLIVLEKYPDNIDVLNLIFRIMHTIKGDSTVFQFENLKVITLALEELLHEARQKSMKIDREFIDLLWEGINLITQNIDAIKNKNQTQTLSREINLFKDKISQAIEKEKKTKKPLLNNKDKARFLYRQNDVTALVLGIQAYLEAKAEKPDDNPDAAEFIESLNSLSAVFLENGFEPGANLCKKMQADFYMIIDNDSKSNDFLLKLLNESFKTVLEALEKVNTDELNLLNRGKMYNSLKLIRVEEDKIDEILTSVRKIDDFINAFGLIRNKLTQAGIGREMIFEFQQNLNELNFLSRDILQMMIKVKVTSPDLLLKKIKELIMVLAVSCNKKIEVRTKGVDILVGRRSVAILEKVLIHIASNCIEHGIESPPERRAANKPETGIITIELSRIGEDIFITVSDDGRGIDFSAIKADAYKKGKISADKLNSITNEDLAILIFYASISGNTELTEMSGRGVGLDIVRQEIKKAGGEIRVSSKLGEGTSFVLKLPNSFGNNL